MKLLVTAFLLTISFVTIASEAETPCPAMNQETREKIVDVKSKTTNNPKTATKQ
jgi:hypothetical protein